MAAKDEARERFVEEAGRAYDEMMARSGPDSGDTFDDIEEQAEGAGGELIRRLLADRLAREAAEEPEETLCPKCGRPMRRTPKPAQRQLDTASGCVRYERSHAICDRCADSFSPSGQPAQDSAPRTVEPPDAQGV